MPCGCTVSIAAAHRPKQTFGTPQASGSDRHTHPEAYCRDHRGADQHADVLAGRDKSISFDLVAGFAHAACGRAPTCLGARAPAGRLLLDITTPRCDPYAADGTTLTMRREYPWGQGHWAQHGGPTVTWWQD